VATLTGTRLIAAAERRRARVPSNQDARTQLGQVLTPPPVAEFMASLFDMSGGAADSRLIDPGAGVGSLAAAFVDSWATSGGGALHVTAVEVDDTLRPHLASTLEDLAHRGVTSDLVCSDFVSWAVERLNGFAALDIEPFDYCIVNPPYRKVQARSP